jgi:integrative and conjugative element protein (TIGR02256 family)
MPIDGSLCLFERETREDNALPITAVLRRAEGWFRGVTSGHWPTDTVRSELESHFLPITDALLPERAFPPELAGHGRMLFVRDLRRHWLDQHRDPHFRQFIFSPLIMTGLTRETGIVKWIDARDELAAIYPWVTDEPWDPVKLAAATEPAAQGSELTAHGYWWSLPGEPRPFRDGIGFLRELAAADALTGPWEQLVSLLGRDLTSASQLFLGLKYPAREGGCEWLIVVMPWDVRREIGGVLLRDEAKKKELFEKSPVFGIRAHRFRPQTLRLRNSRVIDDGVATKTVALIGLGALGSKVAEMLAQAGVGSFRLCDYDYLATGNVARHIGGITDFGARKTRVVMSRLSEINPHLSLGRDDINDGSATQSLDGLAAFIAPADLVISTTADEGVESTLNEIAVLHRKPVLYGRAMVSGTMGRVFLVRPARDACKACLAAYAAAGRQGCAKPADWIDVRENPDDVLLRECGRPVLPGSAVDLSFTAALVARAALDFLECKDTDANHWLWTRLPAGDIDPRLASPMSTFIGRLQRREGCRACQEPDVGEVLVDHDAYGTVVSLAEGSPTVETGGVLIGFVDELKRAVVVSATGPGPNAIRTATRLHRDVPYVQHQLDAAAATLGPKGIYVGEWHSHLSADTRPSPLDVDSLFGIAEAPNYLTRCPVMLIAALGKDRKVADVVAWAFPVGGRMYHIPCTATSRKEAEGLAPAELDL